MAKPVRLREVTVLYVQLLIVYRQDACSTMFRRENHRDTSSGETLALLDTGSPWLR